MCVFCKIINNELPSQKVYEDSFTVVFLDINPVNLGHVLVVPKSHVENFEEASNEDLSHLIITAKKVAMAVLKALNYKAFNIEINNGAIAGQVVGHLHFHVVPRKEDDGLAHWPGGQYEEGQMDDVADMIKNELTKQGQIDGVK